jgi:L-asparaginase
MIKTADLIGRSGLEKCVVLTGAMVPYSVSRSDALFNLGSAVMATQLLPSGTWVAMNGRVLDWKDVKKDRELGMFVRIEPSK